jgi:hypothetical protein
VSSERFVRACDPPKTHVHAPPATHSAPFSPRSHVSRSGRRPFGSVYHAAISCACARALTVRRSHNRMDERCCCPCHSCVTGVSGHGRRVVRALPSVCVFRPKEAVLRQSFVSKRWALSPAVVNWLTQAKQCVKAEHSLSCVSYAAIEGVDGFNFRAHQNSVADADQSTTAYSFTCMHAAISNTRRMCTLGERRCVAKSASSLYLVPQRMSARASGRAHATWAWRGNGE